MIESGETHKGEEFLVHITLDEKPKASDKIRIVVPGRTLTITYGQLDHLCRFPVG